MPHSNELEAKPVEGAPLYNSEFPKPPNYCLFHNYNSTHAKLVHVTNRTYESPYKWYFLTFKPFNSTYDSHHEFYQKKCLDHCRKKMGLVEAYIITRETGATKTHVNILCVTTRDLAEELHNKKTNRYYIYCQTAINRHDCLAYMLKEAKERRFNHYEDYVFYCK